MLQQFYKTAPKEIKLQEWKCETRYLVYRGFNTSFYYLNNSHWKHDFCGSKVYFL